MSLRTAFTTVLVATVVSAFITAGVGYSVLSGHGPLGRLTQHRIDRMVQTALNGTPLPTIADSPTTSGTKGAVPAGASAPDTSLEAMKIQQIVHDYLVKNPDVLVDMSNELDKRQAAQQQASQEKAISDNANAIYRSPVAGVVGNPNGNVTMVEFFDYNCGFCKHAMPDVVKLVNTDGKVRLVLKELPIFGEDSEAAARVALASMKQGKYFEMHQKLFSEPGKADKEKALGIAKELGLNMDQLQKDMNDPSVTKALDESKQLAQKLGLQGTPLYLVGDRVIAGAPDDLYEELTQKIADVRAKGCHASC